MKFKSIKINQLMITYKLKLLLVEIAKTIQPFTLLHKKKPQKYRGFVF